MPTNILIDLNVILDVLLERRGFEASRAVLRLGEAGSHQRYISAHMVTTFAYLLENAKIPRVEILRQTEWVLRTFNIVPVNGNLLSAALTSNLSDYEDAVVEQAGLECKASVIITRNIKDFKLSAVTALTPETYFKAIN